MSSFKVEQPRHWYASWWGVILLALMCVIFAAIIAVGILVFNYWQALRNGQGEELAKKFAPQAKIVESEDPKIIALRKVLETGDDPYLGSQNANLVIVEFLDFKCPICKSQAPVITQLASKYGYKVKIIFRDFPVEQTHPGATRLAEVASCGNELGAFWLFHDYFFANQETLGSGMTVSEIETLSEQLGVDKVKMRDCINSGRGATEVRKDFADGYTNGVTQGTPTYFVNGRVSAGAKSLEDWEKVFKAINL
jgi:protein-disulfide isomerase